jgi:hypothetical protein
MSSGTIVKLGSIAEVIPGVSVRDYESRDPVSQRHHEDMARAHLVPISALDEDQPLNQDKAQPIWIKPSLLSRDAIRAPRLRQFDILITNRSNPRVIFLNEDSETRGKDKEPNVASGPLMIVRLKAQGGLSFRRAQYLAWWLGYIKTQKVMRSMMKGTTVKVLSRCDLEDLNVSFPASDSGINGATTEELIFDRARKAHDLRRLLHEQAELDYMRAQEVLFRMATGKIPFRR